MPTVSLRVMPNRQGQAPADSRILNIQDARAFYEGSGVGKKTVRDKDSVEVRRFGVTIGRLGVTGGSFLQDSVVVIVARIQHPNWIKNVLNTCSYGLPVTFSMIAPNRK